MICGSQPRGPQIGPAPPYYSLLEKCLFSSLKKFPRYKRSPNGIKVPLSPLDVLLIALCLLQEQCEENVKVYFKTIFVALLLLKPLVHQ